ncbi:MAG: hypothetical protein KKH72_13235 [Alphaproteobacteria bacterium]|nr:hypothetical protein [Alphaproteobacteria bacterium]
MAITANAQRNIAMKYLGRISGNGELLKNGVVFAGAAYELEGFVRQKGRLSGTGEISLTSSLAKGAMAQKDLQLRVADGQVFDLAVADGKRPAPNLFCVDITGDLPAEGDWLN